MGTTCFQSRARLAQKSADAATNLALALQTVQTPPGLILKVSNSKHYALATEESQVQTLL